MLILRIHIPGYLIKKNKKTSKNNLEANIKIWRENKEHQTEYALKEKVWSIIFLDKDEVG